MYQKILVGALLSLGFALPAYSEPLSIKFIEISGLDAVFTNFSAGTPLVAATRQTNKYPNSSITLQVFENGTFLTSPTFATESCKIEGVIQSPSFAYRIGEKHKDTFDCKIKDEFQKGSFKTRIEGTASFQDGVLSLSGSLVQKGKAVLEIAKYAPNTYEVKSKQIVVLELASEGCVLKKFGLSASKRTTSPETSRSYAMRNEDTTTYRVTSKTACRAF